MTPRAEMEPVVRRLSPCRPDEAPAHTTCLEGSERVAGLRSALGGSVLEGSKMSLPVKR